MINDYLGSISEISELCLPQGKSIRMRLCITKLKSKDSKLREMRIRSNELSLFAFFGESTINWVVVSIFILIENVSMSVREGASLNILPRDPHLVPILDESGEGKRFSSAPVDSLSVGNALHSLLEYLFD